MFILALLIAIVFRAQCQFKNLDFENPDSSYWVSENEFTYDSTSHSGNYSLMISNAENTRHIFLQFEKPDSQRIGRYRLSGYMRYQNVEGFTGLYASVFINNLKMSENMMEDINLSGTSESWSPYAIDIIADEKADYIVIGGHLTGSGKAWFDSFEFRKIPPSSPDPEVQVYLHEFMNIISTHSIVREKVNWEGLNQKVEELAKYTANIDEAHDIIKYALFKLGDGHSRFRNTRESNDWTSSSRTFDIQSKIIGNNIGYIKIPTLVTGNSDAVMLYAYTLQRAIYNIMESVDVKGWIVDLRENEGGNSHAMIAGVSPLLQAGPLAYIKTAAGTYEAIEIKGNELRLSDNGFLQIPPPTKRENQPIVVLTSTSTGSASELLTIVLKGSSQATVMGTKTFGMTTNNKKYVLSDGSFLFLANGLFTDVNKKEYHEGIIPDIISNDALNDAMRFLQDK